MDRQPPTPVSSLDLTRYLGTWYEIARKPMRHEDATARDVTATYTLDDAGAVRVLNACINAEGEIEVSEGQAKPTDASNARLEVTFLPQGLRWIPFTKGDYWILRVDEDYRTALVGSPDFEYLWLLHREPELDAGTSEAFLQYAQSLGYRLENLIHTPHTGRRTA